MPYRFNLTPEILKSLQEIEQARTMVGMTRLPPVVAERLRQRARLRSTHFSTRIEGNRLTLAETEQVIQEGMRLKGRERDVREVQRYYLALEQIEDWTESKFPITAARIRKLHALLYRGKRARPTPWRDGQNVIRDSNGDLVYLPPEAKDVPALMTELVQWIQSSEDEWPLPIVAGVAHYQFVTIHPFYDGNGRTARALATWILYRGGYDLGRFFSLEEFYAQDLEGYYAALVTHPHHNYYEGRADAEITPWLAYFLRGMAVIFRQVAEEVQRQGESPYPQEADWMRGLDRRARRVIALLEEQGEIRSAEVARLLGISQRQARNLLRAWTAAGWLEVANPSNRGRRYRLRQVEP
jgi:Fic family protein